jgi:hypothetical protein
VSGDDEAVSSHLYRQRLPLFSKWMFTDHEPWKIYASKLMAR